MNKARGERSVTIDGDTHVMDPCFRAVEAIESRYEGLFNVARRIQMDGNMTAVATVIWAAISDGGRNRGAPTLEDVGNAVVANLTDYAETASQFLAICINGSFEPAGEEDEEPDSKS